MSPENSFSSDNDSPATRKPRTDGVQARERILGAALRLFAAKGFERTSVRDIALAAEANIAAIGYYFGDKAGLYRAALYEPVCALFEDAPDFDDPALDLHAALASFMDTCLRPLGQGEHVQLSVRLRMRESFEPTGMLDTEHTARTQLQRRLAMLLARHLGLPAPDLELEALAWSIFAMMTFPYIGREKIRLAAPALVDAPGALDAWVARLAGYAATLVAAEQGRRGAPASSSTPKKATATTERPT